MGCGEKSATFSPAKTITGGRKIFALGRKVSLGQKLEKLRVSIIYDYLSIIILNYACKRHYLTYSSAHHKKANVKFQPDLFWRKSEKIA